MAGGLMSIRGMLPAMLAIFLLGCGRSPAAAAPPPPTALVRVAAVTATPTLDPRRVAVIVERRGLPQTPPTPTPVIFFNHQSPTATPAATQPLHWPVEGALTQAFGCTPYYSGLPGEGCPTDAPWFHDGIDLAVPLGTPVRAALGGIVIFAGADGAGPACGDDYGYGLGVVIEGAGRQALYAHLSEIWVTAGQSVEPGQAIGASGRSGCASGPHLHFGLKQAGQLVDPLGYLSDQTDR